MAWFKRKKTDSNGTHPPDSNNLIEVRQVVKQFNTAAGAFTALRDVDLRVEAGEFLAVIGKSGSGKSTLINMITGIDRPTSGEVWVGGTPVHRLSENQMAAWRGRNVGIVFQFFQLLPTLSLVDNIMLPMDFNNVYRASERRKRALALLDQMDMVDHANKLPAAISGGQQQRVAIARALANDPPILIADEPTGNLDSKTANTIFQMFDELVQRGKTILMVTHDTDLATRVTRSVVIADGQVIEEYLAKTFPFLSADELIAATHKIEPEHYASGSIILQEGQPADRFYIVMDGEVEVLIPQPGGGQVAVTTLKRGQYFGEIELMTGRPNLATIRASSDRPVQVATLDRETFHKLAAGSPVLQETMNRIAQTHLQENVAARAGTKPNV